MSKASTLAPQRKKISLLVLVILTPVLILAISFRSQIRSFLRHQPVLQQAFRKKTVDEQIQTYGSPARGRLQPEFARLNLQYPPDHVAFVAIKDKAILEAYAASGDRPFTLVKTYPILAASGILGPKLREGDCQVPEGHYVLTMEPNTPWHLALRLNYPNEFDLARAKEDGRANPGSDILVHGSNCSIGCLAMGDQAIEDLFVLAHDAKNKHLELLISPIDFRTEIEKEPPENSPSWLPGLYSSIKQRLLKFGNKI